MDTVRTSQRLPLALSAVLITLSIVAFGLLAVSSSVESTPTRAGAATIKVCSPGSLDVVVIFNGPGNPYGAITLNTNGGPPCSLSGRPLIRVVTKSGSVLKLHESTERLSPALPRPTSPVVLSSREPWAVVEMQWCGFKSTYDHVDIRFRGWSHALQEKNPPFSKTSFAPPPCSKTSRSLLGVDYVRGMNGGTIAGSRPTIRVTPSTNLHSGEKVRVSVTGLGLGAKFWVSECLTASDANADGCGEQLAAQPFGLTDMYGTGTYTFTVRRAAFDAPYDIKVLHQCTDQCVLVAGGGGAGAHFADAPITFAVP
jgi:hypothetical protein